MTMYNENLQNEATGTELDAQLDKAFVYLVEQLGPEGWSVRRTAKGVKARWRWFSVGVKFKEGTPQPWRARMRDGMPRMTVSEHFDANAVSALTPVVAYAREVESFCQGVGLFANPSKSYLGHRLWQAVRPNA